MCCDETDTVFMQVLSIKCSMEDIPTLAYVAAVGSLIAWAGFQIFDATRSLPIVSTLTPQQQAQLQRTLGISEGSLTAVDLSHWIILGIAIIIVVGSYFVFVHDSENDEPNDFLAQINIKQLRTED